MHRTLPKIVTHPLLLALEQENYTEARKLINKGADVNVVNNVNNTPLYLLSNAENYDHSIAKLLIEKGADVNKSPNTGDSPLIASLRNRNIQLFTLLLDSGADVNKKDYNGYTALLTALEYEVDQAVLILLEKGADVHAVTEEGKTAIDLAKNKKKIIELLICAQAISKNRGYDFRAYDQYNDKDIKELSILYSKFPKKFIHQNEVQGDIINMDVIRNKMTAGCSNITATPLEELIVYVTKNQGETYRLCLTHDEFDEMKRTNYNPYFGTKFEGDDTRISEDVLKRFKSQIKKDKNGKFILSKETVDLIYFWKHEVFTLGNIYFKIPYNSRLELSVTRPDTKITLYRGMSFATYDLYIKFLKKCGNGMIGQKGDICNFRSSTYSSWTSSQQVALDFTKYKQHGAVVLRREFEPEDIAAYLDYISTIASKEKEYLVLPGVYDCYVYYIDT